MNYLMIKSKHTNAWQIMDQNEDEITLLEEAIKLVESSNYEFRVVDDITLKRTK